MDIPEIARILQVDHKRLIRKYFVGVDLKTFFGENKIEAGVIKVTEIVADTGEGNGNLPEELLLLFLLLALKEEPFLLEQ